MASEEETVLKRLFETLNIASVVTLVPTIVFYLLSPRRREFPSRLLTYAKECRAGVEGAAVLSVFVVFMAFIAVHRHCRCFHVSALLFHAGLFISIANGYAAVLTDREHASTTLCRVQGALTQFGAMGVVVWYVPIVAVPSAALLCAPRAVTARNCKLIRPFAQRW